MKRPRIEPIPKHVEIVALADGSFPTKPGIDPLPFIDNMLDIRTHIVNGHDLPAHYYRRSVGRDFLLERRGWLHLHVGHNIDDNVLLIVEQTEDKVIFIGMTDYGIFQERPAGKSFARLGSRIAKAKLKPKR